MCNGKYRHVYFAAEVIDDEGVDDTAGSRRRSTLSDACRSLVEPFSSTSLIRSSHVSAAPPQVSRHKTGQ